MSEKIVAARVQDLVVEMLSTKIPALSGFKIVAWDAPVKAGVDSIAVKGEAKARRLDGAKGRTVDIEIHYRQTAGTRAQADSILSSIEEYFLAPDVSGLATASMFNFLHLEEDPSADSSAAMKRTREYTMNLSFIAKLKD